MTNPIPPDPPTMEQFNDADPAEAAEMLRACLDIDQWVDEVTGARPYTDVKSLAAAGAAASAHISWEQAAGALDRHPRIGEKRAATGGTHADAAWSSAEQSGVRANQADALAAANRAYEQRFGYIFLICATGLSGEQILTELTARLDHDAEAEKVVVMNELRKIAALRLGRAVRDKCRADDRGASDGGAQMTAARR